MAKAIIIDKVKTLTRSIKASDFYKAKIRYKTGNAKVTHTLPFRVKFINIGIQAYGPGNAAPIGIAIIGVNNYVM